MMNDLHSTIITVNPIKDVLATSGLTDTAPPEPVVIVGVTLLKFNIQLTWGSVGAQFYEIRQGTDWDTATFVLKTSSLGATLNPLAVGTHDYLIKSVSAAGIYSDDAFVFQIIVPALGIFSVTSSVIDNNVLLFWAEPTSSFSIDHYNLYKDSVKYGEASGTFSAKFEVVSGNYLYEVEAVDIVGNTSAKASVSASVHQPPDYTLFSSRIIDWSGTKTNCLVDYVEGVQKLIACVDTTQEYQVHFSEESWTSPNDQVVAGYERFIQDNLLTGSYQEDYDYGTVINSTIVNYTYVKEGFTGTGDVTVTVKTYYKVNLGDAWTGPLTGLSVFIPSLRYLRTLIEFSAANDDSMIALSSFYVKLDVKKEVDSGWVNALASDTSGTVVNFSKTFKDIDGIECTTDSASPITVIVDFTDAPNPTSFKVLCFDSSGRRVDQTVYWIARGIV
jgi:hypothetical protein